ncbi:bis(5'-nucleosyl)-tetraphosphatase [Thiolapillus brandeum]|uniref:Bis(5'-nucleosyl)-tetraphosphatase n=1 Tax=Thiolapillus brandeum TaxID=1076588 RepID=A0A7U6GH75_9GAMM|nr:bis(5'-nucleosyl)-tetraphosphatase [Thiolapillus brandeum]
MVILRREGDRCCFLLLRAWNYWDFPKGEVEGGEAPLDAAIREVKEETGIGGLNFAWGDVFIETPPYRSGRRWKTARYYLAATDEKSVNLPVSEALGRPEHDEYRWVRPAQARMLLGKRLQPVLDWALELSQCTEN